MKAIWRTGGSSGVRFAGAWLIVLGLFVGMVQGQDAEPLDDAAIPVEEQASPDAPPAPDAPDAPADELPPTPFDEQPSEIDDPDLRRFSRLSLEELMAITVTSVEGTAQEWFRSPSAIYVITPEEIRRTGRTTLADALRLAPGVFVGRADSSTWRVAPPGFNGPNVQPTQNLVLIDGRVAYDPLFSGTFWEAQDILLEDLDRIEVIRGPGATLWGSNAVNGVINVITKSAAETQGLYITAGYGDPHRGFGALRYGGTINEDTWYRVWGKYDNWDSLDITNNGSNQDDWSIGRGGFRIDGRGGDDATWMLKAEAYNSFTYGQALSVPVENAHLAFTQRVGDGRISGGHVQFRIEQKTHEDAGWMFQTYYDRIDRVQSAGLHVDRDIGDAEFRHYFGWGERQDFIWGTRFNITSDRVESGPTFIIDPDSDTRYMISAFAQNTSELVEDELYAMLGTKLEYNNYTGVEVQPSARLWWTPNDKHTLWAAVSRAVRTPSRLERDVFAVAAIVDEGLLGGGPASGTFIPIGITGNDDLDSEVLIAYELGHRVRFTPEVTLDTTVFYHDLDRLIGLPPTTIGMFNNDGEGHTYGVQTNVSWRIAPNWRVRAAYSFANIQQQGPVAQFDEGFFPHHMAQVQSFLDITEDLELNAALYYVDTLSVVPIDSYIRFDLGMTWRVDEQLEIAVWGQNLLDPQHDEVIPIEVPRGFYVQATLRY